jgi:hypothetical protein
MSALVIGAAIVVWTALNAGPALWALTGRSWNRVASLAWPLGLWLVALVLLFALIPHSPLLEAGRTRTALVAASLAVTLVCAVPLGLQAWRIGRERRARARYSS